jgi:GNAT superfamily N-acetyltransferase
MSQATGPISFRRIRRDDRERLLAVAARIWEGHDYLPRVFDRWVDEPGSYFGGMELDGRLVGCGRVLAFDERRGWLEGLRVDPEIHRRGLGREMSRHVMRAALDMGLRELSFSTYFDNRGSISISEGFGFRRVAVYTNLERAKLEEGPLAAEPAGVTLSPGAPEAEGTLCNDWTFFAVDVPRLAEFLPRPRTVRAGAATALLCDNLKSQGWLEIAWLRAPEGEVPGALIDRVLALARAEGTKGVHLMLPAGMPLAPFTARGFGFFEQEADVYLYSARAEELRI